MADRVLRAYGGPIDLCIHHYASPHEIGADNDGEPILCPGGREITLTDELSGARFQVKPQRRWVTKWEPA